MIISKISRLKRHAAALLLLAAASIAGNHATACDYAATDSVCPHFELVTINNGADTVSMILRQHNLGRYDRGLHNYLFIPKGQWQVGLTASYGSLDTDDIEVLSVLSDLDFHGKTYSIKPYVGYTFAHNQAIGLKAVYNRAEADLGSLGLDLGDDLNFHLSDVSYHSQTYSTALYYRSYVGLSRAKRFAVFNEVDLTFTSGSSTFSRLYNAEPRVTKTNITEASLNFSPGLCVFMMENISFNVSFGVFGVKIHKESQKTNSVEEGTRITSGANFRFNIFNINFGLGVHI
ncbi:MAG: hypothetical protein K2G94_01920 [Muribaculaceae bacterium]|nr:hypothetical protein [Muribaculaceae bacterium]MDE5959457.1 hypothetical protein [Muribaculaceae bacterium]MDE5971485.1 hypothetical protein [Muribaculaceae bacterium]MDE6462641.1 hypothetical protein [Muribaculaceae bacterium]